MTRIVIWFWWKVTLWDLLQIIEPHVFNITLHSPLSYTIILACSTDILLYLPIPCTHVPKYLNSLTYSISTPILHSYSTRYHKINHLFSSHLKNHHPTLDGIYFQFPYTTYTLNKKHPPSFVSSPYSLQAVVCYLSTFPVEL